MYIRQMAMDKSVGVFAFHEGLNAFTCFILKLWHEIKLLFANADDCWDLSKTKVGAKLLSFYIGAINFCGAHGLRLHLLPIWL